MNRWSLSSALPSGSTASDCTEGESRALVWILGDQLVARHPALAMAEEIYPRSELRIILIESSGRTRRLPYQRKKLVLLFSAMRHYAGELRQQGYTVDYLQAPTFLAGLKWEVANRKPHQMFTMEASEWGARRFQETRMGSTLGVPVTLVPNTQFLVQQFNPFRGERQRVVMEHFYRKMRRHFSVLMNPASGGPCGGRWNYDQDNRKPLPRNADPPGPRGFAPNEITRDVMAGVEALEWGTGSASGFDLAISRGQALEALDDFVQHRLYAFGPYEDAMSGRHQVLYHSRLSPYLNIGLLQPLEVIQAAERAYSEGKAPINSAEGYVRQVLGWREYIYWQYWRLMPGLLKANNWAARRPLPQFFWNANSELSCLDHALKRTLDSGYNHHIERLMLLCNFCLLAGIQPSAVNEWFLAVYVDAYEWVMAPNVIGMGLNADGGLVATKPYISSANYINRMGDYCQACRYDPKKRTGAGACPFNYLYWSFLVEHEARLRSNPRLGRSVLGLRHLSLQERDLACRQATLFLEGLDYDESSSG